MARKEVLTAKKIAEIRGDALPNHNYRPYYSGILVFKLILLGVAGVLGIFGAISLANENAVLIHASGEVVGINVEGVVLLIVALMTVSFSAIIPSKHDNMIYVSKDDLVEDAPELM